MEKPLFERSENAFEIPYKNQCQMKEIWSKNGKWPPKTLEKHWLEKVFASRFREAAKPYKTNGKLHFSSTSDRSQAALKAQRLSQIKPSFWNEAFINEGFICEAFTNEAFIWQIKPSFMKPSFLKLSLDLIGRPATMEGFSSILMGADKGVAGSKGLFFRAAAAPPQSLRKSL